MASPGLMSEQLDICGIGSSLKGKGQRKTDTKTFVLVTTRCSAASQECSLCKYRTFSCPRLDCNHDTCVCVPLSALSDGPGWPSWRPPLWGSCTRAPAGLKAQARRAEEEVSMEWRTAIHVIVNTLLKYLVQTPSAAAQSNKWWWISVLYYHEGDNSKINPKPALQGLAVR